MSLGWVDASLRKFALGGAALAFIAAPTAALASPFVPCGVPSRPICKSPAPGLGIPDPAEIPGKEYSDHSDRGTPAVANPERNIAWDGLAPGGVADALDYSGSRAGLGDVVDREVDALANVRDDLFEEVIGGTSVFGLVSESAALLFSVETSPIVYAESVRILQAPAPWASGASPPSPPGNDIDAFGVTDVDGLEVWGADGPGGGDANRYSLELDPVIDPISSRRVAVFDFVGGVSSPAFFDDELASAISLLVGLNPNQENALIDNMDVDATMTSNERILWSIAPISLPNGPGQSAFDGGEIFVWDRSLGGAAAFLDHHGHLWDTSFDLMGTYGVESENVNALEAIPEPASLLLLGAGLALFGAVSRRRSRLR